MSNLTYILLMAAVTYLIRVIPLTLIRKQIRNRYIRSFLYYIPYVTLSVMTFPAIVDATGSPVAGACSLAAGVIAAWLGADLLKVSVLCCVTAFVLELFLV